MYYESKLAYLGAVVNTRKSTTPELFPSKKPSNVATLPK